MMGEGSSEEAHGNKAELHPLHPNASLLSDNDLDADWMGEFEDRQ